MWPDAPQTVQLLQRAKTGDGAAVNELLNRHRDALRRLVELRLDPAIKRRVDASDIVQDVLVEANRRLKEYLVQPAMPFPLWLRHIAKARPVLAARRL